MLDKTRKEQSDINECISKWKKGAGGGLIECLSLK